MISSAEGSATETVTVSVTWPQCVECVTGCANGRVRGIGGASREFEIAMIVGGSNDGFARLSEV